jgi:hypothetical protein
MLVKLGVVLAVVCAILLQPVDAVAAPALEAETSPSPGLSPEEVVRIQVEALRTNDATDAGIALVFRFASPHNRRTTGPLSRFTQMIRTPPYALMLNHRTASYGPTTLGQSRMRQDVTITADDGTTTRFVWLVSRQEDGPYARCWMTDDVFGVDRDGQNTLVWTRHPVS